MKRTTLLIAAILITLAFTANSQVNDDGKNKPDTTRIRIGNKKIIIIEDKSKTGDKDVVIDADTVKEIIIEKGDTINPDHRHGKSSGREFEGHWHGFEFGPDNYVNKSAEMGGGQDNLTLNQGKSWAFYLNLLQYSIPLVKNNFGIVTGLGLEWNNYSFDNNISLVPNTKTVMTTNDTLNYSKNKFRTTYLTLPIMLEYQTSSGSDNKKFFIGAGLLCGLKLGSSTKQEWGSGNTEHELIVSDDYNLNTFRYGLTARIGYGHWGLFANYNITPLFKSSALPDNLYPLTIGIKVINF
ncbi:MAG: porin family protein [Bacteroidia bacterium]|nr:porin family protein [Bacteroidia bacterium]